MRELKKEESRGGREEERKLGMVECMEKRKKRMER